MGLRQRFVGRQVASRHGGDTHFPKARWSQPSQIANVALQMWQSRAQVQQSRQRSKRRQGRRSVAAVGVLDKADTGCGTRVGTLKT